MEENKNNKSETKTIIALIALIAVLFLGIKVVFAGLGKAIPQLPMANQKEWHEMCDDSGDQVRYQMRYLTAQDLATEEIAKWLGSAQLQAERTGGVFWLYYMYADEYILYLPEQDRTVGPEDITATEETDEDGERTLVLRIRTPEDGEEVKPEEQLIAIATGSEQWRGIRVKVVLDGREKDVHKLVAKQGKLYSTEEVYIGRDLEK